MEPLSIATGALGIATAISTTSIAIYKFMASCKEARVDLIKIHEEMSILSSLVMLIQGYDLETPDSHLPDTFQTQLLSMFASCVSSIQQIDVILQQCKGKTGTIRWSLTEKANVATAKVSLEAHKNSLGLALELVNISLAKRIKNDTGAIQDDTIQLRRDTVEIINLIQQLKNELPLDQSFHEERQRIESWLDDLTVHAETVIGDIDDDELSNTKMGGASLSESRIPTARYQYTGTGSKGKLEYPGNTAAGVEYEPTSVHPVAPHNQLGQQTELRYRLGKSIQTAIGLPQRQACCSIERQIIAILSDDRTVTIWSLKTGSLLNTLQIFRGLRGIIFPQPPNMCFCSLNPELLLLTRSGGTTTSELWRWADERIIATSTNPSELQYRNSLLVNPPSRDCEQILPRQNCAPVEINFIPRTTLVYEINPVLGFLKVWDETLKLQVSFDVSESLRVSGMGNLLEGICWTYLVSDTELLILRKDLKRKWYGLKTFEEEIRQANLCNISRRNQIASIKASFGLPRELSHFMGAEVDQEARVLIVCGIQQVKDDLWIYRINLDNGTKISAVRCSGSPNSFCISPTYPVVLLSRWNPVRVNGAETKCISLISLLDGRELGFVTVKSHQDIIFPRGSDGTVFCTSSGDKYETWILDIDLNKIFIT